MKIETSSKVTAFATIMAVFVYAIQAYFMYTTMRNTQGGMEAQIYTSVQNAANDLYKNQAAYDYYKSDRPNVHISYHEIRTHLETLDTVASLYRSGKINGENFFALYSEKIKSAALFADKLSKNIQDIEDKPYNDILKVAEEIKAKENEANRTKPKPLVPLMEWVNNLFARGDIWAGLFAVSVIFNACQCYAWCRRKRPETPPQ